jgi:hypothetical protein
VATLIAQQLDPSHAARQLGHSSENTTKRHYIDEPELVADHTSLLDKLAG